jgi:hypothetical protein
MEVDFLFAGLVRRLARDISCRFAVADDVKQVRPDLI